ncbi:MAG: ABC transporter ATP-binding protein [Coriobacteriia bacterium]
MGGTKMDVNTAVSSGKMTPMRIALYTLMGVALVAMPIFFEGFGMLFMTRILALVGLYVMLALGLNIVVGYAGLLDLGYIAFYAIGAYAGVIVGSAVFKSMPGLGPWTYFLMIPVAAAFAALTGLALGTPVLRLRGDYLAIVTLGFGEIVRIIINNNAFNITNGAAGLPRAGVFLPKPLGLEWLQNNAFFAIPGMGANGFNFSFSSNVYWYYIIVLLCVLTIFVVQRLDDSRLGRSWAAMREDEVAASSMGVNIMQAKLWAFSLGAVWGGIAGLTFANFQQFVSPESFTFMESVFVVCAVVIGGMGSIPGAIIGALLIQGTPEIIRGFAASGIIPLKGEQVSAISNYRNLVFGLVMVMMMAWRPQGILPSKRRASELRPDTDEMGDEESETLYDAQHDTGQPGE